MRLEYQTKVIYILKEGLMRVLLLFLLCFSCIFSMQIEARADFEKTKIAVLDFRLQGNDFATDDMGKIVAEWLITAFVREGRFEVIERKLLGEVLEEQQMVYAGIVDQETASEIGKLLGVKVIISGSVVKLKNVIEVNARIVDVSSASIITAESVSCTDVTSLRDFVTEMARKIMKNFPLEGYVADRNGDNVVIDLGKKSGVKPGMTFLVYNEGDVIKHPKTGEILYVSQIDVGIIKITKVKEKIAQGVIVDEMEEGTVQYGDLIKSSTNGSLTRLPKKDSVRSNFENEGELSSSLSTTQKGKKYSSKTLIEDGTVLEGSLGRLFVETLPSNAKIRILNIVPKYSPGILLEAGSYNIEVTASGYQTSSKWYSLESGEDKQLFVELKVSSKKVRSTSNSKYDKYFSMILSDDTRQVQKGAKYLYRKYRADSEVIDTASKVLAKRYNEHPTDSRFADGMAYLCKILGQSGQSSQKSVLLNVSENATSRKVKSYATKSLSRL